MEEEEKRKERGKKEKEKRRKKKKQCVGEKNEKGESEREDFPSVLIVENR